MKGIEGSKFAVIHRDRQTPAFPTGQEAVEDELDVGSRLVQLSHKIAPVFLAARADESIELFPYDQSTVTLQSL